MTRPWSDCLDAYVTALPRPIKYAIAIPAWIVGLLATGVIMAGMVGIALVTGARR